MIWDPAVRSSLASRIQRVRPDAKPRWGKRNANQMVLHCAQGIEMMMGTYPVKRRSGPLRFPPLRYLIIHVFPFPKSAPTAPELIPPVDAGDFSANVARLQKRIVELGERGPSGTYAEHPAFGRLSPDTLGVLGKKHLDHHLKQFGV